MNHSPHCVPCFLRRVLHMANLVTADEWLQRKILGEAMVDLARVEDGSTPPEVMHEILRRTARTLGSADPYQEEKRRWRDEVLANADAIRERLAAAGDRFLHALRASIAANIVDDELREGTTLKGLLAELEGAARDDDLLDPETVDDLRASVRTASSILFVHDSVGELFFDRLLIEEIRRISPAGGEVISVVRSAPALGDATREDAEAIGLDEVATIVDPGLECLGLPILECSSEFREIFRRSDLLIGKGQAVYQTLEGEGRTPDGQEKEMWFLFRVKCPVMSRHLAVSIGDLFLERN